MNNITKGEFPNVARKKRKKRTGLVFLFIAAILVILALSPVNAVRTVTVSGIKELTPDYVIAASGVKTGDNPLFLKYGKIKDSINKTPYLSCNDVKYRFPGRLSIDVTEKMPVVYYAFADGYVGINVDGYITDIIQVMERKLPVASGIVLTSYSIGEKPVLDNIEANKVECLTEVANELAKVGISDKISLIDVAKITNIILKTENGLTVKCGNTDELEYKLSILKEVLQRADCKGIVDISIPGRATYEMT